MNVFLFQCVLDSNHPLQAIRPGTQDTWSATRYRSQMHPGDLVFFWLAGDELVRGLYAWGRITSDPYLRTGWDSHGVDVTYETKFTKPILAKSFRDDRVLADMLIFRAPQATNFLLSARQAERLLRLVKDRGETAPILPEAEL